MIVGELFGTTTPFEKRYYEKDLSPLIRIALRRPSQMTV